MKKFIVSLIIACIFLVSMTYATSIVKVSSQENNVNVHCEDGTHSIRSFKSVDFPEASKIVKTVNKAPGNHFSCDSGRCSYSTIGSYGKFSNLNDFKVKQQSVGSKFGKGSCLQKAQNKAQLSC